MGNKSYKKWMDELGFAPEGGKMAENYLMTLAMTVLTGLVIFVVSLVLNTLYDEKKGENRFYPVSLLAPPIFGMLIVYFLLIDR